MARDPIAEIIAGARRRGLDPNAVLAVASVEGLSGGIGDQGTSFGPWQLHIGGALPKGIKNPHQWAWSRQGINYALDRIAGVAAGQRGRQAVASIVHGFERPADPVGEVQRAMGVYGRRAGRVGGLVAPSAPPARGPQRGAVPAGGLDFGSVVSAANEAVGLGALSPGLLTVPQAAQPMPRARRASAQQQVNFGGSTFKHKRGKTINFLAEFARPFGVQITSTTHGNHVRGSYHYRGRAVDFGGDPQRMAALAHAALSHPQDFAEMFYTGPGHPGAFIKDGQVIPLSELDHSVYANHKNHVHLAR